VVQREFTDVVASGRGTASRHGSIDTLDRSEKGRAVPSVGRVPFVEQAGQHGRRQAGWRGRLGGSGGHGKLPLKLSDTCKISFDGVNDTPLFCNLSNTFWKLQGKHVQSIRGCFPALPDASSGR
jgi:hypothetical protein